MSEARSLHKLQELMLYSLMGPKSSIRIASCSLDNAASKSTSAHLAHSSPVGDLDFSTSMFRVRVLSLVCEGLGSRSRLPECFRLTPEVGLSIGIKKIEILDNDENYRSRQDI
jgi:hypothetical protein